MTIFSVVRSQLAKNDPVLMLQRVLHWRQRHEKPSLHSVRATNAIGRLHVPQSTLFLIKRCRASHCNHSRLFDITAYKSRGVISIPASCAAGKTIGLICMGAAGLPAIIYHNLPRKPELVNTVTSITTSFSCLRQVSKHCRYYTTLCT